MTELVNLLDASRAVTTVLGLCAFLAALFTWLVIRKRELPLHERLLGEGSVRPRDVVRILENFSSDEHRLKAMRLLVNNDSHKAEQLLTQAKAVERIGGVSLKHMSLARNFLIAVGGLLLLLGIAGIAGSRAGRLNVQPDKLRNDDLVVKKQEPATTITTQPVLGTAKNPFAGPLATTTVVPDEHEIAKMREYPRDLPGFDVRSGQAMFHVLKGHLERLSDETATLTLSVQLVNDGPESVMFFDSLFRLLADDVPIAPNTFTNNEWVAREAAKTGDVSFVIPISCKNAILRVGHPPEQTNHAVQLNAK